MIQASHKRRVTFNKNFFLKKGTQTKILVKFLIKKGKIVMGFKGSNLSFAYGQGL